MPNYTGEHAIILLDYSQSDVRFFDCNYPDKNWTATKSWFDTYWFGTSLVLERQHASHLKAEDQPVIVATTRENPYAKWKFEQFNPVQSRVMDFYDKDNNGLIASSTSSGKTVVV